MKWVAPGVLAALLVLMTPAPLAANPPADRVGDAYELRLESVSQTRGQRSSGSSQTVHTLVERVIAVREDGVELEFDLPGDTSAEDRAREWQFPVRVFKAPDAPLQLLNETELEARVQVWLERGGMTDAACGRWIFTWTAIKIECDPMSVLGTLEAFDLRSSNTEPTVEQIDPEAARQERAEADVAVAEMTGGKPVSLEAALQARASEQVTGTITTTTQTDTAGRVTRRVTVLEAEITEADGSRERRTTTTTVERNPLSQR